MEFTPIGYVRSPFKDQHGTPIQPSFAKDAVGELILEEQYKEALADVDGFERLWVLCAFHRTAPYKPRLVPYRDTVERGLFATRAPSRPNPIGLSVVKLLRVEGNIIHVTNVDMLDGTPILDIKPYVPRFDAYPNSKAGWLDRKTTSRQCADGRFEK